jgi:hypothetical protein
MISSGLDAKRTITRWTGFCSMSRRVKGVSKSELFGRDECRRRSSDAAWSPVSLWRDTTFLLACSWGTTVHPRSARLPVEENDGQLLRQNRTVPTVTWIGHSTLLIQIDGVNLLTDPHWSNRASPLAFAGPRRLTPPGLRLEHLPSIDLVLISHDHYDHLDIDTIQRFNKEHRPLFVVPRGLEAWLTQRGITKVVELDWWDHQGTQGLTLTCLPAQHFSGRSLWDRNQRLWCGGLWRAEPSAFSSPATQATAISSRRLAVGWVHLTGRRSPSAATGHPPS